MIDQLYPYNPTLSAQFFNLTIAAEAQFLWESSGASHPALEDPFQIPIECYDKIFAASKISAQPVKDDVEGAIRETYEFAGSIRFGQMPIADYEEVDGWPSFGDVQNFETALKIMTLHSRRLSESIKNTVRYNWANPLLGFALRSKLDGHGVIVLRGTMTTDEWLNNINYRLRPFSYHKPENGQVHRGFRDIYKGLRGRYRELARQFEQDQKLFLVGHSLGAAVSMLGALDLAQLNPEQAPQIQAYLFGGPRVGDTLFAKTYNQLVPTSYRVVNVCDVVPYIPFEEINTVADVLSYPYADTKGEIAYVHQAGNPIANHIASYHLATQQLLPSELDVAKPHWLTSST